MGQLMLHDCVAMAAQPGWHGALGRCFARLWSSFGPGGVLDLLNTAAPCILHSVWPTSVWHTAGNTK